VDGPGVANGLSRAGAAIAINARPLLGMMMQSTARALVGKKLIGGVLEP